MSFDDIKKDLPDTQDETVDNPLAAFEEVGPVEKKPQKQHKLKKQTRTILIASVAALVLAGALVLVTILLRQDNGGSSGSTSHIEVDTSEVLLDKAEVGIDKVDIHNQDATYTVYYDKSEDVYRIKGYEDLMMDDEITKSLTTYAATITAAKKVDKKAPLKDYGLDKPAATATIRYKDGTTATLSVGNQTPTKDGYYVRMDGNEAVYIFEADKATIYTFMPAAYIETSLITPPDAKKDDANGSVVLKEIAYSGANFSTPMKLRRSYHTDSEELSLFSYIIVKPYVRSTSDTAGTELASFKSLTASQAVILHPTAAQKAKLGLGRPAVKMQATLAIETSKGTKQSGTTEVQINEYYGATTSTILVGDKDQNGDYYVMVEGIDAIFLVNNESLSMIAERTYENTVNPLLFLKNIADLSRIVIKTEGKTYDFRLTHYSGKEDESEKMTVTMGKKTYDTTEFRELYQLLMGLERYKSTQDKPRGSKATMEVTLYDADGKRYMGAKYYPLSGTLCAVNTDEGEWFTTRWKNITHFTQQIENYIKGEKVLILAS